MLEFGITLQAWSYNQDGNRLSLGGEIRTCAADAEADCVRIDVGGVRFYMSAARLVAAAQAMYIAIAPPNVYRVEVHERER